MSEVVGSLGMMIYREAGECGLLAEPIFWPLAGFLVRRQGRVVVHPLPTLSLTEGEGIVSDLAGLDKGFEISDSDCLLPSQGAVGRLPPPPSVAGWRVGRGWRTLTFPALPGSMLIVSCSPSTIWLAWSWSRKPENVGTLLNPFSGRGLDFVKRQGRVAVHPLPTLSLTEGEGIASDLVGLEIDRDSMFRV